MEPKATKTDQMASVETPTPPQQIDPSRKPEKDKQNKNDNKPAGKKPLEKKKLAPNEEL